jgi:hypothetical protein
MNLTIALTVVSIVVFILIIFPLLISKKKET